MSFPTIETSEINRIAAIGAMIESNHDAEALTATRMLLKSLARHDFKIAEVLKRGLSPAQLPPPRATWTASPPAYDPATRHQFKAAQCLSNTNRFNAKERDFLREMRAVRRPSQKQRDWLDRLHARIVEDF